MFALVYPRHRAAIPDLIRVVLDAEHGRAVHADAVRAGDLAALNAAIELLGGAAAARVLPPPLLAGCLSNLGVAVRDRYMATGAPTDLENAIDAGRSAVATAGAAHPDRPGILSNLSVSLRMRFDVVGDLADSAAAIEMSWESVQATPDQSPHRPLILTNHAMALFARSEYTGSGADLDEAVAAAAESVARAPAGHPDRATCLANHAAVLERRAGRGNTADFDAAVAAAHAAVDATPEGSPDLGTHLGVLGNALRARWERYGSDRDLDEAIEALRSGAETLSGGHKDRASFLANLGMLLRSRFDRAGVDEDLDAAVAAARASVAATAGGDPRLGRHLSILGTALESRFQRSGAAADLDEAIAVHRTALRAFREDQPERVRPRSNLSRALLDRASLTGSVSDLDEAVSEARAAVAGLGDGAPNPASAFLPLSAALGRRFRRTGRTADLDGAVAAAREIAEIPTASPGSRLRAARRWGQLAAENNRWAEALRAHEVALDLLGLVVSRGVGRADQERFLAEHSGLASVAAACGVRAGNPGRAVELLEQGRGLLLAEVLETRADLGDLEEAHPDLAARFAAVRDALGTWDAPDLADELWAGRSRPSAARRDAVSRRRRADAAQLRDVVARIRGLEGFEEFLRPPSLRDLITVADRGPIVFLSASPVGSFALIVHGGGRSGSGPVTAVELPGLTGDAISAQVDGVVSVQQAIATPGPRTAQDPEQAMTEILGWLWDEVAEPVVTALDGLGLLDDRGGRRRVWWCPCGPLSFLPVHAAGRHGSRPGRPRATVMDRMVSSYIPSLRAYVHARRGPDRGPVPAAGFASRPAGALLVAMPVTPEASALPSAEAEGAAVRRHAPGPVVTLAGAQATFETVTGALPAAGWVHFACHGYGDLRSPSRSRLLLHDHLEHPLTVVDVARLALDRAELAYLSACSTARPGGQLADESLHLATAFQLAGYRHVIATLWPISDVVAAKIAETFYSALAAPERVEPAYALHRAVVALRDLVPERPSLWASHLHAGP